MTFAAQFKALTDHAPFPWQESLYRLFCRDELPTAANIPTGLGKTAVMAVWLLALAHDPTKVRRRLVYVVNRRTVVDQATREAEKIRTAMTAIPELKASLANLCAIPLQDDDPPLAISTLRGQFVDNRQWSADPARPAIIIGTVDMIGSRLLFSGYGIGFKSKPLHAGFLGHDALLVHDEAHLEPAFQELLKGIKRAQHRCTESAKFDVMELSATSRDTVDGSQQAAFTLTPDDKRDPVVMQRILAKKHICLHECKEKKELATEIVSRALEHKDSGLAILVFARAVEDVDKIVGKLKKENLSPRVLTGTIRGLERDRLVEDPVFKRFLPGSNDATNPRLKTAYLVCTSAGEVGINISADHMVCDLSTFESMAQRFGRVNRFGNRDDSRIDVVYPKDFDQAKIIEQRLEKTLDLLRELNGDGSPSALDTLDSAARAGAFSPPPLILPVSDILLDAWSMTTIREKLPGRPPVEPYLHGKADWEPPETHVAWRNEVSLIIGDLLKTYQPQDLLEDYPLKPHEVLRDKSSRVFDRLKKLSAPADTPVWVVADDDSVDVTTIASLIDGGQEAIEYTTVLLPPLAGGLDSETGMLASDSASADDVADELLDKNDKRRRVRLWDDDEKLGGMRRIRPPIDLTDAQKADEDESPTRRFWHWYELPEGGDGDGSMSSSNPVLWRIHTKNVEENTASIIERLPLRDELKHALTLAAKWHDLGKKRELWQRSIGHRLPKDPQPDDWLGKSGGKMKPLELTSYRHEFGSLLDVLDSNQRHLAQLGAMTEEMRDVVLHVIAVHHGFGRPHFADVYAFDPHVPEDISAKTAAEVPRRFARLQRRFGHWGLAYLESLLRAADWAASAEPSEFVEIAS